MRDKIKEIVIKTIKTMCETAVGCIGSSVVLSDVAGFKFVVVSDISVSILSDVVVSPDIVVSDVYANLDNEYSITVDVTVSYGTIETVLGIRKRDLYYLNTAKQTLSKEQILDGLMKQDFIKYIIISSLRGE